MKKQFKVRFTEVVYYEQTVEADSPELAIATVREQFENGDFVPETGAELSNFEASQQAGAP